MVRYKQCFDYRSLDSESENNNYFAMYMCSSIEFAFIKYLPLLYNLSTELLGKYKL